MVIKASVHCGRFIRGDYANSNNSYCSFAYGSDNGSGSADFWPGIKKSLYNLYTILMFANTVFIGAVIISYP